MDVGWTPSTASQWMVIPISVGGGIGISLDKRALRSTFLVSFEIIGVFVTDGLVFWRHARARFTEDDVSAVCRGLLVFRCIVMESRTTDVMCSSTRLFNVL